MIPTSLAAEILSATDPASRRLVVRLRPPAGGMAEWLGQSMATVAAPVTKLRGHSDASAFERALTEGGGSQWARRASELWLFASLQQKDVVVAGDDAGNVFAVGLVKPDDDAAAAGPGRHRVGVYWWTKTLPQRIAVPPAWRFQEVCEAPRRIIDSVMMEGRRVEPLPEPPFPEIVARIANAGLRLPEPVVRRYHVALKSRGFVILAGVSGTGKTWLAELYARAVGARHLVVPVAPNWTSNEDLLGYRNPLDGDFHATEFTHFLEEAAGDHREAKEQGPPARPFHLVLDEMNLAPGRTLLRQVPVRHEASQPSRRGRGRAGSREVRDSSAQPAVRGHGQRRRDHPWVR